MTRDEANQFIDEMKINEDVDVRMGMSTRTVCKESENKFVINDFTDGWNIAKVNRTDMQLILIGEKSLLDLNWR
jgi:hypothetical protein